MDSEKKLRLLEGVFEIDEGDITPDMDLDSIENWDSMTKLALIVMVEEEFGKVLSSDIIRSFNSVGDIMAQMEQS